MLAFLPWSLLTLASSVMVASKYESPQTVPAVVLAYSASPLFMVVGYYLGYHPEAMKRVGRIYVTGCLIAIFIAIMQEFARGALPAFLAARIYKEKHVVAGGMYNESIFASPQVLAVVMFPLLAWTFMELLIKRTRVNSLLYGATLILIGYTIFLSRIRVAVPLAFVTIMFILVLARKTGMKVSTMASRVIIGGFVLSVMFAVLVVVVPEDIYTRKAEIDRSFFGKVLRPHENFIRLLYWMKEIEDLPNHSAIFGYGVGTGSRLREVVGDYRLVNIPTIYDTGIAMLYHEMGLVGLIAFAVGFVMLPLNAMWRILKARAVEPAAIASLGVCGAYLGWFLFKHHTVLINTISHLLWMGVLGVCFASLTRGQMQDDATMQDAAEQPWPYAGDEADTSTA
jgi:hypothetical protein